MAHPLLRTLVLAVATLALASALPQMAGTAEPPRTIREIVVEGLQRSTPDSVRSYLLVQEGDPFDEARIDRSLKSLFATGRFADVSIREDGDRLIVTVVENPTVNRVAFEGNGRINDETLEAEVILKPLGVYTRSAVESDVRRILTLYRRSGRFGATVEPKIIELPQNRVDVVFEINEGDVTGVETIRFVGNKEFSDSTLRSVIRTKESRWWRILSSDDTYDPDRLSLDRELLRRFYLKEGYADFQVVSAVAELAPDREAFFVTFTIEEGERYRISRIDLTSTLPGLEAEELRDVVDIEADDWYDAEAVETTIDQITEEVGNRGFAFVEVQPKLERNRDEKTIAIGFDVSEGRRVFVERIDITGNVRTLDKVIRREFRLAEGDAFNAAKLRRSRQRIQDLDFFEKVTVEEKPGSAPDRAVVDVQVEEKSTGALSLGAGFSTGSGFLGDISIRERNLLGRGQDLRASLLIGQRQQQVDLAFTEPYFLDREIAAGFDVYYIQVDRQDESSFDTTTLGTDLRARYPITESLSQGWRYSLRRQKIEDVPDDASVFVKEAEGADIVSEVSHNLTYDRRNSRINPTDGYFTRLTTDVAGLGGSVAYMRNRLDTGFFYPLAEQWVLSLTTGTGYIFGLGEDVRLLDRFFIGGSNLRGFADDGVGPRDTDTDDALGGEIFYTGSVQVTFPLGLPDELQIRGRAFTDVGSSWDLADDGPQVADESSPRVSVGTGITWVSPLGPIGVDAGFAILKEEFDDTEILRVNFGTRF